MLLILPPSETKRDGGEDGRRLDLAALGFPELTRERTAVLAAVRRLSRSVAESTRSLGLGPTQRFEIDRNRTLGTSPVMPALDRYTGVLFDGLAAHELTPAQRAFADRHVVVTSALFGVLGASDPIPAYRLSHDSRLPGLSLRRHWASAVSSTLAARPGLVLDLRSEAYAVLGPAGESAYYVRVLAEDAAGRRFALSHFNKKGKGEFTRAVIEAGIDHESVDSLLAWATERGIRLERGAPGELDLVL